MIYFVQEDFFPSKVAGGSAKSVKLMSDLFLENNLESKVITTSDNLSVCEDDIIIFNSVFGSINRTHLYRLFASKAKIIIIPRGELSVASISNRRLIKTIYLYFMWIAGFYRKVKWVATSEEESQRVRFWFPGAQVQIIPNLMEISSASDVPASVRHGLCSVGRLELKKNQAWLKNLNREIDLIGHKSPREENYWRNILESSSLHYRGNVAPDEMRSVYTTYKINLLPTLNENFGHVIVESITNGLPVIVSENTPWTDLINSNRFGKSLPLDPQLWEEAIEEILSNYSQYHDNCIQSISLFRNMNKQNIDKWIELIRF